MLSNRAEDLNEMHAEPTNLAICHITSDLQTSTLSDGFSAATPNVDERDCGSGKSNAMSMETSNGAQVKVGVHGNGSDGAQRGEPLNGNRGNKDQVTWDTARYARAMCFNIMY
jgi:hypothetical protein